MHGRSHVGFLAHACHTSRTDQPAIVIQVRLHDIRDALADAPAKAFLARFLFAECNGNFQRVGHSLRSVEVVERAWLLIMNATDAFELSADLDRFGGIVGTVSVGMDYHFVAEHFSREWN